MLPHYASLKVAEQFRVLDAIAPGRIDLGLGRAPGSDGMTAHALNPQALKRLIANGVKVLPFSNDIMAACYKATREVYEDIAAKNAKFKTIYTPWKAFRDEQVQWFGVAEARFDTFMGAASRLRS